MGKYPFASNPYLELCKSNRFLNFHIDNRFVFLYIDRLTDISINRASPRSHGTHLDINKHNDLVINWVQIKKGKTTQRYVFIDDNVRVYRHVQDYPNARQLFAADDIFTSTIYKNNHQQKTKTLIALATSLFSELKEMKYSSLEKYY